MTEILTISACLTFCVIAVVFGMRYLKKQEDKVFDAGDVAIDFMLKADHNSKEDAEKSLAMINNVRHMAFERYTHHCADRVQHHWEYTFQHLYK